MTQANLLAAYATRRDAEAFAQIVEQYQRFIFATCRRRLSNAEDIEDAVQETFLRLAQRAGELHTNVGGWLHACAVNVSIDINRRKQNRQRHETTVASTKSEQSDDPQAKLAELREHLDSAMAKLNAEQRELIIQRYFLGRPQNDLAAEANVAPSTITHRLDRAVEQLRKHLSTMGCVATAAGATVVVANLLTAETASASTVPSALTANVMKIGLSGVTSSGTTATAATFAFATVIKSLVATTAAIAIVVGVWEVKSHRAPVAAVQLDRVAAAPAPGGAPASPLAAAPTGITVRPDSANNDQVAKPPQWQATTAPAAVKAVLAGRILDKDGKPVPNASVTLTGANGATVKTDADGNYAFATIRAAGEYRIGVEAEGFVPIQPYVSQDPGVQLSPQSTARRDIVIERGVTVVVTVTDGFGQPLQNASVDCNLRGDEYNRHGLQRKNTNAAGQAVYTLPVSKSAYVVAAMLKGNAPAHALVTPDASEKAHDVNLTLEPGISVKGLAICNDGKPATGWAIVAKPEWWASNYYPPDTKIDQDGNFTLTDLASGPYSLHISWNNSSRQIANVTIPPATQPLRVDVPLASPGVRVKFSGRVRFLGGKTPRVQVMANGTSADREFFMTDVVTGRTRDKVKLPKDEGEFTFNDMPTGTYTLNFESQEIETKSIENVKVPGEFPIVELKAIGKSRLAGTVLDGATEQRLSHFAVRIRKLRTLGDAPNYVQDIRWIQVSQPNGQFEVDLVGPGVYQAQISLDGYAWAWTPEITVNAGEMRAFPDSIKLVPGGAISGIVTDTAGKPIAGAKVIPLSMAKSISMGYRERFESEAGTATTDEQGRFTVPHLSAGFETLKITHAEHAPLVVDKLKVANDQTTDAGTFAMHIGGNVEGVVYDAGGKPFAGATLNFQDENGYGGGGDEAAGRIASITTDDNGHFRVDHLADQLVYINVAEGWQRQGVIRRLVKPTDGQTSRLDFGGTTPVKGRVLMQGQPLASKRVELSADNGNFGPVTVIGMTDGDGRFAFAGPPAGRYTLFCESGSNSGSWTPLRSVEIAADQPLDLGDLAYDAGAVIITVAADDAADLQRVQYVSVETDRAGEFWQDHVSSGGAGAAPGSPYVAALVPAGQFRATISLKDPGEMTITKPFQRKAGEMETPVTIRLPRSSATLTLHPAKPADSWPTGLLLYRCDELGLTFTARGEPGKPLTLKLPPGTYRALTPSRLRDDVEPITLKDGEVRDIGIASPGDPPKDAPQPVEICVWSPQGVPVTDVDIELTDADGKIFKPLRATAQGQLFSSHAGRFTGRIHRATGEDFTREVDVADAGLRERSTVELVAP